MKKRKAMVSLMALAVSSATAAPREWQVVQDYVTLIDADAATCTRLKMPMGQRINPFLSYTAIATDFGFVGPGETAMTWNPGHVCVRFGPDTWGGLWHSLEGSGGETGRTLDFTKAYPPCIAAAWQPKVVGIRLRGKGHGRIGIEIKDAAQNMLWTDMWSVDHGDDVNFIRPLPPLRTAKFLNWTSLAGCQVCVDQVSLEIEMPALPTELRVFLKSYAKLARCHDERTGLVKDRAHAPGGAFDSIPASGMFCLASAVAAKLGIVEPAFASGLLRRTEQIVGTVETRSGLLPHFVRMDGDQRYRIHPGTEFSSVDTAIYSHSMLIAAQLLGDAATGDALMKRIRGIPIAELLDGSGRVIHGIKDDGTRLSGVWEDWGGETALVLLLQRLVQGDATAPRMKPDGKVWQGTGFIPEIQSLLFPGFDTAEKDRVSGQDWAAARAAELKRQRGYFRELRGPLAETGLFGLSAGEGRRGMGYLVSGTDLPKQEIIHPHYVLMSACLHEDTAATLAMLERLEKAGVFPPWGLVENVDTSSGEMLPMLGSLNASFEALAAYHLLAKHRREPDVIYEAVRAHPGLRASLEIFYP